MSHYNGSDEYERHIATATHKIINLFYKNEITLNVQTLSTNMKATFDTMENYGEGRSDQEKVKALIEKIRTTNHNL